MMNWRRPADELPPLGQSVLGWWGDDLFFTTSTGTLVRDDKQDEVWWSSAEDFHSVLPPIAWADLPDRPTVP